MRRFENPELEVTKFELADVIATSNGNPEGGDNDLPFSPA